MNPKTRLMLLVAIAMPAGGIVFAQDGQSDIQRRIAEARQKSIREMSERRQQQGAQAFAPREVAGPGSASGPATQAAVDPCEKSQEVVESWRKRYVDENLQRMANQLDKAVKGAARYHELVRRPASNDDEASSASIRAAKWSALDDTAQGLRYAQKLLNSTVETLRDDREVKEGLRQEAQSKKIDPETWAQCSRAFEIQTYPPKVLALLAPDQRKLLPKIESNFQAVKNAYQTDPNFEPIAWVSLETRGEMLSYVEP
ncbi:MAG: hypothetical protein A2V88_07810 [Elusimicrobia bacterium RBG_16_66_12]|nr:MAG: hypothetical protein A2V88_07810 [Elusimicrobia bacterium RBG_16_66_12]